MSRLSPEQFESLVRLLDHTASDGDRKVLADWLAEDPMHEAEWGSWQRIWAESGTLPAPEAPDTDMAWNALKETLNLSPQKKGGSNGKILQVSFRWFAAAASVALLLLAGWWSISGNPDADLVWQTEQTQQEVELPDGSRVLLFPKSRLVLNAFSDSAREVTLIGMGQFSIKKDPHRPFRVSGFWSQTEVLGTVFTLIADSSQGEILEVLEGRVAFQSRTKGKPNRLVLTAGEMAKTKPRDAAIRIQRINRGEMSDMEPVSLSFQDAPLPEVARALERHFGIPIQVESPGLSRCRFTGSFPNPDLDQIEEVLKISNGLQSIQQNGTHTWRGPGCP